MRATRSARRSARAEEDSVEVRRPAYQADLAGGVERLFEPNLACCPWCASADLRRRLATTDLVQRKPGRFSLDQCQGCGHVFQNPRLSADGLDFYYRDFYDGLGERCMGLLFNQGGARYRSSAQALRPVDPPRSWLDVGTGHGHFCNAAREVWPQTAFDGLDMGAGVELAARRGWVDRAWRGRLVDLASDLAGGYDVVSMFHYLEHTTDPHAELAAAAAALRPGGHLLIEVPDPQSRWAGLLGRWWLPWFQPQHLHLIPAANLRVRLAELGFTVTLEQHAEPHIPVDLLGAAWLALNAAAPADDLPWLPRPSRLQRLARAGTITAGVPVLLAAALADQVIAPVGRRAGLSNAYRILARKN
ncbi:MAG: class I SAM-dependent methyltransferase [Egibacteraceae bacterium]